MRVVLVGYLLVTALFYCYTGAVCIGKAACAGGGYTGACTGRPGRRANLGCGYGGGVRW